ncbi:MAG: hypothetical protein QNK11_00475 [Legionella sp.]|nr:hypothetical protein [Legionella sp.]
MLDNKAIIVVLGMHRSGTSAITRGLKVLGASFGHHLMPVDAGSCNPKGFWEDQDIVNLNDEVLHFLGHGYYTLEPIYPAALNLSFLADFKLRAVKLLTEKMSKIDCFALKDPRMSRLLPFWRSVFEDLKLDVKYVIASRHPMSVVQSLAKRDNFSHEKSYLLWFEHVLFGLMETQGQTRIVVDYDRMMENPKRELSRVAKALDLTLDEHHPDFIEYTQEFLDATLTHTQYKPEDLSKEPLMTQEIITLYQLVYQCATDQILVNSKAVTQILNQLSITLKNNHLFLYYLKTIESKLQDSDERITYGDEQIAHRDEQITHRDEQITHLSYTLKHSDEQIALLTHAFRSSYSYRLGYYLLHPWKVSQVLMRKLRAIV